MEKINRDFACKVGHVYNEELGAPEIRFTLPNEFKRIMDIYVVRTDTANYERPCYTPNGDIGKCIRRRYLIKARLKHTFRSTANADFWAGLLYDQEEYDSAERTIPSLDLTDFHNKAKEFAEIVGQITNRAVEDTTSITVTVSEEKRES